MIVMIVQLTKWRSTPKVIPLPDEIWTLVVLELELKDILAVRSTCRFMRDICAAKVVWRQIYLQALGPDIPKPFFLSKPLKEISAKSIERAMRAWRVGWTPTVPLQHFNRQVDASYLEGQHLDLESVIVLPGGRWVVVASSLGSVWWFDLSDDWTSTAAVEPRMLIPATLTVPEGSDEPSQVKIAIDSSSEEALGPSIRSHYLSRFNITVATRSAAGSSSSHARVGVWRIDVSEESGGSLVLGACLSTYTEAGEAQLTDLSLYGAAVAYGMDSGAFSGTTCVVIVEWEGANVKTEDDEILRRYIPSYPARKVVLLPGGRILLIHEDHWADLIDWQKDGEPSTLPPSQQAAADYIPPIWSYDGRERGGIYPNAMAHPLIFSDATRLVLPASRKLTGVAIAHGDPDNIEELVQVHTLFEGRWRRYQEWQVFAYRQAVGSRSPGNTFFAVQYRWPDDSSGTGDNSRDMARFTEVSVPDGMLNSSRFVTRYDQYSQRIILVEKNASQFVTLTSRPP